MGHVMFALCAHTLKGVVAHGRVGALRRRARPVPPVSQRDPRQHSAGNGNINRPPTMSRRSSYLSADAKWSTGSASAYHRNKGCALAGSLK
jgi:hypothetical protein